MERCLNCMEVYDEKYDVCPYCGFVRGTPPEVASHLVPGVVIADRYIIGTVMGHGGFGVIYQAWDEELGIRVAIKEYYPNGLVNRAPGTADVIILGGDKRLQYEAGLQRFLQEARTMAKFGNVPNIVHVYGFLEANNTAYIIMERLEGITLREYLGKLPDNKMPAEEAIDIIREIGKALIAIHKGKVVHRDISPDNIFICDDGRIKLLDFGAARLSAGEKTQTLSVILKPGYAPPEQYRTKSRQGPRTDVYALAATLYRMITGKLPVESLDRMVEDTLEKPSDLDPEIPSWLDSVILTGMACNAEVRFSGVDKFIEALDHEKTVKLPQQRIRYRRLARTVSIVVIALIVGISGYTYFGMYSDISGEGVPDGEITFWVPVANEADETRYLDFEENFEKKFKGKTMELRLIDSAEYADTLNAALAAGKGPDAFFGDYVDKDNSGYKDSIRSVFGDIPLRHMYLLKDNKDEIIEENQIPIGAQVYVLYENTYLSGSAQMSFVEDGGAEIDDLEKSSDLFDPQYTKASVKLFDEIPYSENALGEFLDEQLTFYVGNSSQKMQIQKTLSGYSDVTAISEDGEQFGVFRDHMAINSEAEKDKKKIVQLMIKYALSEEGQNVLCVRNQGILPLNRKTFGTFTEINSSMSFLDMDEVTIIN